MRFFALTRGCRNIAGLVLSLILLNPLGRAAGLPEWGMSPGAAAFMIRVVAIKSPPLSGPVVILGRSHSRPGQGWPVSTSWLEGYEVSLKNVTRVAFPNPIIQYIVYVMDPSGQVQRITGTEALNEIPVNGEINFVTNEVMMQRTIRTDGHNTLPGKLLGVRLRVYDHKNQLIQDYAAPWVLMVWQKWDFPLYTEGGGMIYPILPGVPLNG